MNYPVITSDLKSFFLSFFSTLSFANYFSACHPLRVKIRDWLCMCEGKKWPDKLTESENVSWTWERLSTTLGCSSRVFVFKLKCKNYFFFNLFCIRFLDNFFWSILAEIKTSGRDQRAWVRIQDLTIFLVCFFQLFILYPFCLRFGCFFWCRYCCSV